MISGPFRLAPTRRTVFSIALRLLDGFLISQKIRKLEVKLLMMVLQARVRICPKKFLRVSEMSHNVRKCPKNVRKCPKTTFFKIDVWKNLTAQFRAPHAQSVLHRLALKTYRTKSHEFPLGVLFMVGKCPNMSENVRKPRFGHIRTYWCVLASWSEFRTDSDIGGHSIVTRATPSFRIF